MVRASTGADERMSVTISGHDTAIIVIATRVLSNRSRAGAGSLSVAKQLRATRAQLLIVEIALGRNEFLG
jgi:hypothetical protein